MPTLPKAPAQTLTPAGGSFGGGGATGKWEVELTKIGQGVPALKQIGVGTSYLSIVSEGGISSAQEDQVTDKPSDEDFSDVTSGSSSTAPATTSTSTANSTAPTGNTRSKALFTDVTDVTLDNGYYPTEQPMLSMVTIQFPESVNQKDQNSTVNKASYSTNDTDNLLQVRPQNLISFEYNKVTNGTGTWSLVLFDPTWGEVEDKIVKNRGFLRFKYGYADAERYGIKNPWIEAQVTTYAIEFGMNGVKLAISGMGLGYSLAYVKVFDSYGTNNEKISEIVKKIADDVGSFDETIIEPTNNVHTRESIDSTDRKNKVFNTTGQSSLKFILDDLAKYAKNEKDQGNYVFYTHVTPDGKKQLHFHTIGYDPKDKTPSATPSTATTKNIMSFTWFKQKNTPVINFSPVWNMTIAQLVGAGGTSSTVIDVNSKQTKPYTQDMTSKNSPAQKFQGKPGIVSIDPQNVGGGYKDGLDSFNTTVSPARTDEENKTITQAEFSRAYQGAMQATLKIVGINNLQVSQKIAVIVYIPQMDNSAATIANVHWISGYFIIAGISEHISGGQYTTTLQLIGDGRGTVAPDTAKSDS